MTINRKIRGIRDSIPPGYILGRASNGNGPPQLIKLSDLAQSLATQGGGQSALVSAANLSAAIDAMGGNTVNDVLTRTASGWKAQPPAAGGAAGPNPFVTSTPTVPAVANFTLSQSTGGTMSMANLASGRGIALTSPSTASSIMALMTANGYTPPSTFTLTALLMVGATIFSNNWEAGLFLEDGTGKIQTVGIRNSGNWIQWTWTNINTSSTVTNYSGITYSGVPVWIQIKWPAGSTFNFNISFDGENFFTVATITKTSFIATPTAAGICFIANGGSTAYVMDVLAYTATNP